MYTVIVRELKQILEMRMFRFFEIVGVIATAMIIAMTYGIISKDSNYLLDPKIVTSAVAAEDAKPIHAIPRGAITFNGGTTVHPTELQCMARNIYFEANNQSKAGQVAVARVVVNRVNDTRFPNTVCGVITEGPIRESWKTRKDPNLAEEDRIYYPRKHKCQFSWYCDGKADNIPSQENNHAWQLAQDIAFSVLVYNKYAGIVEGATHYHADYVDPEWNKTITLITKVDDHIFYRWD